MDSTPVQLIEKVYEAFRTRDMAAIVGLLSPEVEITQSEELPWGGVYRGLMGVMQFFGKLRAEINSTVAVERLIHAGDHVVAIGWTSGTVNATGATYNVPIAHVWQVKEGRIAAVQFLIDNPTMLAALATKGG